jgi:Tfp pilus assembly protein PilF
MSIEDFVSIGRRRDEVAALKLKKALRINPGYLVAGINLVVAYEDQERWEDARRAYRKILEITRENRHIQKRLGRIS